MHSKSPFPPYLQLQQQLLLASRDVLALPWDTARGVVCRTIQAKVNEVRGEREARQRKRRGERREREKEERRETEGGREGGETREERKGEERRKKTSKLVLLLLIQPKRITA